MSRQPFERRNRINVHQEARDRCYLCNGAHTIKECHQFKKLTPWERHKRIRSIQACFMCLIKHNGVCRSEQRCGIMGCQGKHHKMLHFTQFPRSRNEENMKNNPKGTENKPAAALTNLHYQFRTQVFYQIIPVTLRNNGYHVETFAFIDPGSSLTLVDKQVTNQLRLEGIPDPLKITWTQNYSKIEESSERVKFKIMGSNLKEYSLDEVRTVENLQLPMQTVDYQDMCADFPYLSRLPISSYKRARPRILIGLNHSHSMLPMNKRSSGPNKPMAIETPLGWLIFGNITEGVHENHVMMIKEEEKMHEMMKNYFSTEEFGVRVPERLPESKESIRAKEIVDKTLKYDGNRYEIGLLWKQDDFKFPESYTQAHKRLTNQENKYVDKPEIKEWMNNTIHEYIEKGYARKLSEEEISKWKEEIYYLPHFIVVNQNKPDPKPRLVFDAAAMNKGVSFNSALISGLDATTSLFGVALRFREGKVAVAGDIKEMFCQVKINEKDQKKQCFLFRNFDQNKKPDIYTMQVMTFGSTCSPACAQIVKKINIKN